ncbi:Clp protease N-terminal domain-containing protein [Pseudonocardia sp.]|uniref:Clp protease N-terminal domain-containing protein n=1 Tax=Pseudonocardia sp. TaxID=60912 RepID=UPI00261ABC1F|nr:Clp protease N-terminal domain-containing protein [Pseudonocardia sp.]
MLRGLRRARADIATMNRLFPAAEQIARADGLERPGAEHLLMAALELDDPTASEALRECGVTAGGLHEAVRAQHAAALEVVGIAVDDDAIDAALPPFAPSRGPYRSEGSAQRAFRRAVALAKHGRSPLLSAHVLLAVIESRRGTVARALAGLGVDHDRLADVARRELDRHARERSAGS